MKWKNDIDLTNMAPAPLRFLFFCCETVA